MIMVHAWWGQTRCILGPDHPFCCAPMQFCCACNKSGPFWTLPRHSSATFYFKFRSRLPLIQGWSARRIFQETHQGGKCCANFIWDLSIHLTFAALSYLHGISGATMVPLLCRLCHSGYVHRILWLVKGSLHSLFRKNGWTVCSWESVCNFSPFFISFPATKWLQSGRNDSFDEIVWGSNSAMTCNKSLVTSPSTSRLTIVFSFFRLNCCGWFTLYLRAWGPDLLFPTVSS